MTRLPRKAFSEMSAPVASGRMKSGAASPGSSLDWLTSPPRGVFWVISGSDGVATATNYRVGRRPGAVPDLAH
ncbi:hypothetical protein Acor_40230 [Acrocarpospora corrugata]|uniref:Uncharacterized protein n=1 Tax=Acrocarpospora corrugata TaxID=35763 RepID=A0A5M3W5X4_9ACTN|nr:hypothetical protein Acor_40230 [Acrocarpospora corrugata]